MTVVELLIVVIILGIISAFGIPNFARSRDRAAEKSAAKQAAMVKNAMRTYLSKEGVTRIPNTGNNPDYDAFLMAKILNTSIIEPPEMTFQCWDNDGTNTNYCRFLHNDGWSVGFHDTGGVIIGGLVRCTSGTCPNCTVTSCPY